MRNGSSDDHLDRWRRETPGCRDVVHLNNAGSALPPEPVTRVMVEHLEREARLGGYEAADAAAEEVASAYEAVGRLVAVPSSRVAFVENATVAFAQALAAFDFEPGDVIVTSRSDYPSNQIMYLALAERRGVKVVRAPDGPDGGIDPDRVADLVRDLGDRCRLVAVSWVPTHTGLIQDVEAVGEVCERFGVPYLVDACQAVGQLPVDCGRLRCDYLAATARKFLRGPRGAGFLAVSEPALTRGDFPLLPDMRGGSWAAADRFEPAPDARRFENWEFSYALVLGQGEAARYALEVGPDGGARARELADYARERLAELPDAEVLDRGWETGQELAAIVSVAFAGHEPDALMHALRRRGIHTSVSRRPGGLRELSGRNVDATLRASPHYYNTAEEIDRLTLALDEILEGTDT